MAAYAKPQNPTKEERRKRKAERNYESLISDAEKCHFEYVNMLKEYVMYNRSKNIRFCND